MKKNDSQNGSSNAQNAGMIKKSLFLFFSMGLSVFFTDGKFCFTPFQYIHLIKSGKMLSLSSETNDKMLSLRKIFCHFPH